MGRNNTGSNNTGRNRTERNHSGRSQKATYGGVEKRAKRAERERAEYERSEYGRSEHPKTRRISGDGRDFGEGISPAEDDLIVFGKNAVWETLVSGAEVNKLVAVKDSRDHTVQKIIDLCKEKRCPIRFVEKAALDRMERGNHQGVILFTSPYRYYELDEVLQDVSGMDGFPLFVILDGITDPHNLGAILRSAEAAGADAVIIPKRGSAVITSTVVKISSGAAEFVKVVRVGNLVQTINKLKERNIWVAGTSPDGETHYTDYDFKAGVALVIGSEGKGISRLVSEHCDTMLRIDMKGNTSSLNASVATGILMFEALRQRR